MKDLETRVRESLNRDAEAVRFEPGRWTEGVTGRRRYRRGTPSMRTLGVVAAALVLLAGIVVPLALVSRLGGDEEIGPGGGVLKCYGLGIKLPAGWNGRIRGPAGTSFGPHLHAANFELLEPDDDVASRARAGMSADQVTIVVIDVTTALARDVRGPQEPYEPAELPARIRAEDFTDRGEGIYPGHAFARRQFSVAGRSLELRVEFGTDPAPEGLLAEANGVLASLTVEPLAGESGYVRHVDQDDGLALTIPEAWSFDPDPTRLIEPENVLAIGSWPFPRGGVCAPFDAIDDLPPDGVFMWLIEYHGPEPPEDFVPRPERFDLRDFSHGEVSCYAPDPQYQLRFRDAGRNFQVQIAFGPEASESLQTYALRALESLETGGVCDAAGDAYVPSVDPVRGSAGSTATITGEIPHGEGAEGGSPADPTEWVEVWWNLDPSDPDGWPSALPGGEDPIPAEPGPVLLLGRLHVAGTCTYELPFTVPETSAGTYPIVVLYGSDVSGSAFRPAWFEVTG
jgi:hypothetical protein